MSPVFFGNKLNRKMTIYKSQVDRLLSLVQSNLQDTGCKQHAHLPSAEGFLPPK
jgi:hypothetical protein